MEDDENYPRISINHLHINKNKFVSESHSYNDVYLQMMDNKSISDKSSPFLCKSEDKEDIGIKYIQTENFKIDRDDINFSFDFEEFESIHPSMKYIQNYNYYVHCVKCSFVIAGESEVNNIKKLFVKIENIIIENVLLIENYKLKINDSISYIYVICKECNLVIGIKFDDDSCFLLCNKISIEVEKQITIGLLSLKNEKIELMEKFLKNIIKNDVNYGNTPKINIIKMKHSKESLQKINKKELSNLDFLFIIHKVEGRLFLLGKNGFYNKLYEKTKEKINLHLNFILLYKNIFNQEDNLSWGCPSFQFQSETINNLIDKGDQKELVNFKNEDKIVCLDDDNYLTDLERRKDSVENLLFKRFTITKKKTELNNNITPYVSNQDQTLFDHLIKRYGSKNNSDDSIGNNFKCFVL